MQTLTLRKTIENVLLILVIPAFSIILSAHFTSMIIATETIDGMTYSKLNLPLYASLPLLVCSMMLTPAVGALSLSIGSYHVGLLQKLDEKYEFKVVCSDSECVSESTTDKPMTIEEIMTKYGDVESSDKKAIKD